MRGPGPAADGRVRPTSTQRGPSTTGDHPRSERPLRARRRAPRRRPGDRRGRRPPGPSAAGRRRAPGRHRPRRRGLGPPPGGRRRRAVVARGRPRRRPPGRRGPVRGGRRRPPPPDRRPRLDHRPAGRHARVRRAPRGRPLARRLRGPRRAVAARRRASRAAPSRCPACDVVYSSGERIVPAAGAGERGPRGPAADPDRRQPQPAARGRDEAGRARRRRARPDGVGRGQGRRGCSTGPWTPTCTPAASTSGTRPPRSPSRCASGFVATRLDGSPLVYNQPTPWSPDLVVCHPGARGAPARPADLGRRGRRLGGARMTAPRMAPHSMSQLRTLEAESIHIFREVAAEMQRPCLLFSGGKDSIVMLHIARKAFAPARIPFPVMHVDTGLNFPSRSSPTATAGSRSSASSWSSPRSQDAIERGLVREEPNGSRNRIQTPVLLEAAEKNGFDALFGGGAARRGEGARQGARVLVPRRVRPVGPEEPAARDLEPLQRPRAPRPEHPRVPAVELDRARHLDVHRRGGDRDPRPVPRRGARGRRARRDALRGQPVHPAPRRRDAAGRSASATGRSATRT